LANLIFRQLTYFVRYLVDLEGARYYGEDTGDKITSESNSVEMFGAWNEYAHRKEMGTP
jgi:hypothetical protein